jgi:glutathione peroxidase
MSGDLYGARSYRLGAPTPGAPMGTAFDFTFKKLASPDPLPLSSLQGRVLLVVNVASACGFTSQYRELESLYEAKQAKGLVVLGVPCNEFGRQEKGAEPDIAAFCDGQYSVKFPMTGKVEIIGKERHPFFRWIAAELGEDALPRWNFHKYLIGRDGAVADSFPSSAQPLGPKMLAAIDRALAA